jgi:hypothetical protein
MRQIILNAERRSVSYFLEDKTTGQAEGFSLNYSGNAKFVFEGGNQFTGIEWWNKMGNYPYPIRYQVEISQLMYGTIDSVNDSQSLVYFPFDSLTPNSERHSTAYPVSFYGTQVKDGCICYNVSAGNCNGGLRYNC